MFLKWSQIITTLYQSSYIWIFLCFKSVSIFKLIFDIFFVILTPLLGVCIVIILLAQICTCWVWVDAMHRNCKAIWKIHKTLNIMQLNWIAKSI